MRFSALTSHGSLPTRASSVLPRKHQSPPFFSELRGQALPQSRRHVQSKAPSFLGRGAGPRRGGSFTGTRARTEQAGAVRLILTVAHQVEFGECVGIMGSAKWLGRWKQPVEMRWSEEGWTVEIETRPGDEAEFKFVVCGGDKTVRTWEGGANRRFAVPSDSSMVKASATWGSTEEGLRVLERAQAQNGAPPRPASVDEGGSGSSSGGEGSVEESSSAFAQQWRGREVAMMRSNQHGHDRAGVWDTTGLSGAALALVQGDSRAGNWWRKLEVVQNLLTPLASRSELEPLVYSAIYLQWINSGQIPCVEDGGHHRPNKHANISRAIFGWMERDSAQQALAASPEAVLVMRKMHPRLPAFTSEFTASVPLTRIRDIAHRNDIPHDLKQEIKHTIQNKLHRNAGPEDLVATELLLRRVTAKEGEYSSAFVEQLRIFYRELKDFFNAASLTEQLDGIRPALDEATSGVLDNFLGAKQRVDALSVSSGESAPAAVDALLAALHALTGLRAALQYHLSSGLRNDAAEDAVAMRQKWRLSEIGLEDYSFVLLSRLINEVEAQGGSDTMSAEAQRGTARLFDVCAGATVLALRQVGLSGWEQAECLCLEHELAAWQKAGLGDASGGGTISEQDLRWWALRFKASLDRVKRLTASYTETMLHLYSDPAKILGKALGIEGNAIRTFAEAEVRASVVFQLDKVVTLMLKCLRTVLRHGGWDVLMPGIVTGVIKEVQTIDPAALQDCPAQTILLVHRAEGDEEVRAAGSNIQAVILLQELPHLSHLAVRARQERVPLVTLEDDSWVSRLQAAAARSERVKIDASVEGVHVTIPAPEETLSAPGSTVAKGPVPRPRDLGALGSSPEGAIRGEPLVSVVPLSDAVLETCGAKAASCAKLLNLSSASLSDEDAEANFYAPQGVVIPYGVMDSALKLEGAYSSFVAMVEEVEHAPLDELAVACAQLRSLVAGLPLPRTILELVSAAFPPGTRIIARSSANVEDLEGLSGAGLYDSIPNIPASEPAALSSAISTVWASLYSRRAILSRRTAGVRQQDAQMAVLVQELMSPDLSFVLHTKSLLDNTSDQVYAEVAPGLGETLASGARGSAWRLSVHKVSLEVSTSAMANFSEELLVPRDGLQRGVVVKQKVDYSTKALSLQRQTLQETARKLCKVGKFIEESLGNPQDIEGCFVGQKTIIVQARPQP